MVKPSKDLVTQTKQHQVMFVIVCRMQFRSQQLSLLLLSPRIEQHLGNPVKRARGVGSNSLGNAGM